MLENSEVVVALIGVVPQLLVLCMVAVVWLRYRSELAQLLPRISSMRLPGGLEFGFAEAREKLREAATNAPGGPTLRASLQDQDSVLIRAERVKPVLRGARLLWVDDHPKNNTPLRRLLNAWGTFVDEARSTDEAMDRIVTHSDSADGYHVVISDMRRDEQGPGRGVDATNPAGLVLLNRIRRESPRLKVIFYVGQMLPAEGAFAITNRPDHLLHYVMDVLERERWAEVSDADRRPEAASAS